MLFALMLFTKFVLPFYDLVVCTMLFFLPISTYKVCTNKFYDIYAISKNKVCTKRTHVVCTKDFYDILSCPSPNIKFALKGNVASCICYPILEALYHDTWDKRMLP